MLFNELELLPALQEAVAELGYQQATAIQSQAIPLILKGGDLMAGAQTGTGKTAAFALPMLQRLAMTADKQAVTGNIRGLVLVPTRELARQVYTSFVNYGRYTTLAPVLIYGGESIDNQLEQLQQPVDIIIATPGRLIDLLFKRAVDLSTVQMLVLDEADRMLDMGFSEDIDKILEQLPSFRQTMLFSATFDNQVFKFSKRLLNKPDLVEVDKRNSASIQISQTVYTVDPERKSAATAHLIRNGNWQQVLIFCRTKKGVDALASTLGAEGINAAGVHGDKSQAVRNRVLEEFREGKLQALVATDLAARGLDIEQLNHVVNYELPFNAEDYVHRIGRTGRAGNSGVAVSLVSEEENYLLEEIETLLDSRLMQQWLTGYEPDLTREIKVSRKNSRGAQKQRARERAMGAKKGRRRR